MSLRNDNSRKLKIAVGHHFESGQRNNMEELQDAIEDAQYMNAMHDDVPKPTKVQLRSSINQVTLELLDTDDTFSRLAT